MSGTRRQLGLSSIETEALRIRTLLRGAGCRVYNDANISIPNITVTALTFNTERFDPEGMHSTSTNTSKLTAIVGGVYWITGHLIFNSNNTGMRRAYIMLNRATVIARADQNAVQSANTDISISTLYQLTAGDYVELLCYQSSGGALDVVYSAACSPEFGMVRMV